MALKKQDVSPQRQRLVFKGLIRWSFAVGDTPLKKQDHIQSVRIAEAELAGAKRQVTVEAVAGSDARCGFDQFPPLDKLGDRERSACAIRSHLFLAQLVSPRRFHTLRMTSFNLATRSHSWLVAHCLQALSRRSTGM